MRAKLQIEVELLTPAYAGGASPTVAEPLRGSVLKNLLRFWWRALHPELRPRELFRREEQIFGSTRVGQGLRVVPRGESGGSLKGFRRGDIPDSEWLRPYLGYGAQQYDRKQKKVAHAQPGFYPSGNHSWNFDLFLARSADDRDRQEICAAIWLISVFGAFGRRSRHGFGAIRVRCRGAGVESIPGVDTGDYTTFESLVSKQLRRVELLRDERFEWPEEPEHSAFGKLARLLSLVPVDQRGQPAPYPSASAALGRLEETLSQYRRSLGAYRNGDHRYPRNRFPPGPDHKWRVAVVSSVDASGKRVPLSNLRLPEAIAFGAPLPGTMSSGWAADVVVEPRSEIDHRASPLLSTIVKPGASAYVPVLLYLPGRFLPEEARLHVQARRPSRAGSRKPSETPEWKEPVDQPPDASAIGRCLDWMARNGWREVTWR